MKYIKLFITFIFYLFTALFIFPLFFSLFYILLSRKKNNIKKADAVVVFGAKVKPSGPSYTLLNRTKHAAKIFLEKNTHTIIVSGNGKDNEPEEMKKILIKQGIPEKTIIMDNHGFNTLKTIKKVKQISSEKQWENIVMVSSKYHLARIKIFCKREGIKHQVSAPDTILFSKLYYFYFRETIAVLYYLIFRTK